VLLEELGQLKNAITLSEIEPLALWLVAYWHEMSNLISNSILLDY
jgi:uncharacterized membrane protein (DUF2068 family)